MWAWLVLEQDMKRTCSRAGYELMINDEKHFKSLLRDIFTGFTGYSSATITYFYRRLKIYLETLLHRHTLFTLGCWTEYLFLISLLSPILHVYFSLSLREAPVCLLKDQSVGLHVLGQSTHWRPRWSFKNPPSVFRWILFRTDVFMKISSQRREACYTKCLIHFICWCAWEQRLSLIVSHNCHCGCNEHSGL